MQFGPDETGQFFCRTVHNRQQGNVSSRKDEVVALVRDPHSAVPLLDFKAIALQGNDRMLVERLDNLPGEPLDQPEIKHIAIIGEAAIELDADLIIVAVQRLAKARIGYKMG